jgi:hypothetical protein
VLIRIIDGEQQWQIDLSIDEPSREAFLLQSLRESLTDFRERFLDQLAAHLPAILQKSLDPGLQAPTERQINFAFDISRVLGVAIPSDAARYKESMAAFISHNIELFRERTARTY